jgi:hypothetical protein
MPYNGYEVIGMTAETYRKGKIVEYLKRLMWRRETYRKQLEEPEYEEMKQNIIGQLQALDLVIKELINEFGLQVEDFEK